MSFPFFLDPFFLERRVRARDPRDPRYLLDPLDLVTDLAMEDCCLIGLIEFRRRRRATSSTTTQLPRRVEMPALSP